MGVGGKSLNSFLMGKAISKELGENFYAEVLLELSLKDE